MSAAQPDLLHETDQIIHQVFLHDLAVVPFGDRVEVDFRMICRSAESPFRRQ
jgi:hypothetical protein